MQCPFLRKMNVKYCGLYRRTMIPLSGSNLATERCTSPGFRNCPLLREHVDEVPAGDQCPWLSVTDVHYCDIAPVRKLIPCNRTAVSRCTDDGHRYCQLYLAMVDPPTEKSNGAGGPATGTTRNDEAAEETGNDGLISMPPSLAYAPNHLWLHRGDGSTCHVGVDAFFTHALGRIDMVSYPYHRDDSRPVARFTVGDATFDLVFPNSMQCTEINAHLAVEPSAVLDDPYGRGWLFEGLSPPAAAEGAPDPLEKGMLRGEAARRWMEGECGRLAVFAHEKAAGQSPDTGLLMQDGGRCHGGLADVFDSSALFHLHAEFFSLFGRRRTGRES